MRTFSLHKLCVPLLAAAVATAAFVPAASAADPLAVQADGKALQTSTIHKNDRQFVRAVFFRKLGVSVSWIEDRQAVVFRGNGTRLELASGAADLIHRPEGTYVPLRYAAETLGMTVGYDPVSQSVSVLTNRNASAANNSASSIDEKSLYWLEQITEAEAGGESLEGKIAVAAVILNRVDNPDWPDSIVDVVFQIVEVGGVPYYQFSPVLDQRIYEVEPSAETVKAVRAALAGEDPTGGANVFYNPAKTDNVWVRERPVTKTIGNHIFAL
ncbi:cell wall hydrolase [Paenibacillus sp. TRM 82003]|nr:cell wall hydrolase [Paenibacillus sp. TRM 82003]